ncbi:N-acetyl-gamma-glutamyl-phosphate reductase [Sediminitomix flava]|uniref:N-acetyl-gamma-glutamyl-phosphate reductase n=1 Tax=Sediminitomix flava TaxID=379075 RepID=A0A315Z634_SEDFL|nr:N-acetyl-gamma-glutamyl-phosphate reductase [Sediminitomix flava]PWJ39327.1 N-acetyl-gamma-glutamyl-phosphate reductase [Sediminitomix flava]
MKTIKAGIIGGAGFTGGELIRVLLNHPNVELGFIHSRSHAGEPLHKAHADLVGETAILFTDKIEHDVDVIFLCLGHGESKVFLDGQDFPSSVKIIDLSQDFRLRASAEKGGRSFVYGLPELNKEEIKTANNIANPGCFATAIQLALMPLADAKQLNSDIHISAVTGSTGAGQSLTKTTGFTWRNNNISHYKAFKHQHLFEISESLDKSQEGFEQSIHFIPYRGNFTRGILASVYLKTDLSEDELKSIFQEYYQDHVFTHVIDQPVDVKLVVNTNKCLIHVEKHGDMVLITSAIDNLLKGAVGQATHNMNLLFGLEEKAGLNLKPSAF